MRSGTGTVRALALSGIAGTLAAIVLVGGLHLVPPTSAVNPIRRTISEYALSETSGWVFNLAVLALAAGSLSILVALVRAGVVRATSGGAIALILWSASLAGVVYFPKHNWAVGPSLDGHIHRGVSLIAFLSLPIGVLLVTRMWRTDPGHRRHAIWSSRLGMLALSVFGVIIGAVLVAPALGRSWWRLIPLGAVERTLVLVEVAAVLALGIWAVSAARSTKSAYASK